MSGPARADDSGLLAHLARAALAAVRAPRASDETVRRATAFKLYVVQQLRDAEDARHQRLAREQAVRHRAKAAGLDAARALARLHRAETAHLRARRARTAVSDYALLTLLGRGGYGEVFLARERATGRLVALKRMRKAAYAMKNAAAPRTPPGRLCARGTDPCAANTADGGDARQQQQQQLEEVRKEREVLARSASPWIVRLHCCFQDARFLYMAMEYAPGGDLRHMLDSLGTLDEPAAAFYFSEMCLAVDYLHTLGYVHRDLKPSNFVLDSRGHLKLIDCLSHLPPPSSDPWSAPHYPPQTHAHTHTVGLSVDGLRKRQEEQQQAQEEQWQRQHGSPAERARYQSVRGGGARASLGTQHAPRAPRAATLSASGPFCPAAGAGAGAAARRVVGSPEYMSPEVVRGEGCDRAGDLWALGCVLHEMLVGVTPFGAASAAAVFENIRHWRTLLRAKPVCPAGLLALDPTLAAAGGELVSDAAWALVTALLRERGARLGEAGIADIARHPWLQQHRAHAPWDLLRRGRLDAVAPPFVPQLDSPEDTSYFAAPAAEALGPDLLEAREGDDDDDDDSGDDVLTTFFQNSAFDHNRLMGFTFKAFPTLRSATLSDAPAARPKS